MTCEIDAVAMRPDSIGIARVWPGDIGETLREISAPPENSAAAAAEFRKRVQRVRPDAMARLRSYSWPGNVRELRNAVERAMLLAEGGELAPEHFNLAGGLALKSGGELALPPAGIDLDQLERSLVVQALERGGWNQTRAGGLLGLNRDQIRYRIEKFKLEKPANEPA